jgi:type I restriction enzyme S subunit
MSELPAGWVQTSLGALCSRPQYGWTTSARKDHTDTGGLRFLRTTDITHGQLAWSTVPFCKVEPPNPERYLLMRGDVVISRAGSVGFSYHLGDVEPAVFASYLIRFRPSRALDGRYVAYFLQSPSYWRQIHSAASGITLANVNAKELAAIELPLAPLAEQRRIVAAIEEQFSRLDAGAAALVRIRQNSIRMRAAVLQSTALRQSGWVEVAIDDTIRVVDYRGRTPPFSEAGVPHLRSFNVKNGAVVWGGCAYVTQVTYERYMSRGRPAHGDLLFTTEAPMGEVAFAPEGQFCMAQRMMLLKPDPEVWHSEYLMLHLRSPWFQGHLQLNATGTTVRGISSRNFRPLPLLAPPLNEQARMAKHCSEQLAAIDTLERELVIAEKHRGALRSSVLAAAFSGQLVPQDPSDEPASILLDRIAVERASSNGERPTTARSQRGKRAIA